MYTVEEFYRTHRSSLELELVAGASGLGRELVVPEAHRPGLALAGYLEHYEDSRVLVFGRMEIEYLADLYPDLRIERLSAILTRNTPMVLVSRNYSPGEELLDICQKIGLPFFRSSLKTAALVGEMTYRLAEVFSPFVCHHGTFVEVYGLGVLIEGESSIGKSEAALGLIERDHRLVADDVVKVRRFASNLLYGEGVELTRHHMEIRGIGIINVAELYGAICVREKKRIDLIVRLEAWNEQHTYDRVGLDSEFCDILGVKVPYHVLPVGSGRDVVLLLEVLALNYRLKRTGHNAAEKLQVRLASAIKANHEAS